jgi:Tfp pilus assembly protein PilX
MSDVLFPGRESMWHSKRRRRAERGVALVVVVFALAILSALGIGLLYMTDTSTVLAADYRDSQRAYFEARAGIQEAIVRLVANDTAVAPTSTKVVYIINKQNSTEKIEPWNPANKYRDTELCHESVFASVSPAAALAPCTTAPSEANWYASTDSTGPNTGTASALNYKWVRINLKVNASAAPMPDQTSLYVKSDGSKQTQVYWNDTTKTETLAVNSSPVFVITSLAVLPNGTRRMVQAEVVLPPSNSSAFKYAMFATSNACDAINMSGGVYTDSYDSTPAQGSTTPTMWQPPKKGDPPRTGGDIATFGNVRFSGSTKVNGSINVPNLNVGYQLDTSACTGTGSSISYSVISSNGGGSCVPGYGGTPGPCPMQLMSDPVPPTPPTPTLLPPGKTISYDWQNPDVSLSSSDVSALTSSGTTSNLHVGNYKVTLTGGSYDLYDVLIDGSGTLTLQPGTYNINSLTLTAGGKINIDKGSCTSTAPGACAVILNVAGGNKNLNSWNNSVAIDLSGGTFANNTYVAGNLQINYGGTKETNILAGTAAYMAVNAPNSKVTLSGNGQLYGAVIGKTIVDAGSANVHYDQALQKLPTDPTGGTNGVRMIALRGEVMY